MHVSSLQGDSIVLHKQYEQKGHCSVDISVMDGNVWMALKNTVHLIIATNVSYAKCEVYICSNKQ